MMSSSYDEIRQGSVVQTIGPGAMTILQRGVSVMVPGLDAWYLNDFGIQEIPEECILLDAHLSDALGVSHFVQPPAVGISEKAHSKYLNVFVFPRWAVCYSPGCKSLVEMGKSDTKRPFCPKCLDTKKKKLETVQVNFVIACEAGHLDEFPWFQWVHKSLDNICSNPRLTLSSKGSGNLSGQKIQCICGAFRSLSNTSDASEIKVGDDSGGTSTYLTENLDSMGRKFICVGGQPWLRRNDPSACGLPVRMILRNSNNIYYGSQESSILVPSLNGGLEEIANLLKSDNKIGAISSKLLKHNFDYHKVSQMIMDVISEDRYDDFTVEQLATALESVLPKPGSLASSSEDGEELTSPTARYGRFHEWEALANARESEDLVVRPTGIVSGSIAGIQQINAVPRLKETRVLKGFSRIKPVVLDANSGRDQFRRVSRGASSNWFPAVRSVGEGIFINFDLDRIRAWEEQAHLQIRIGEVEARLLQNGMANPERPITPRLVLIHTLAHLLIQELVIECGYTAASLRERIYSSDDCAALLIYTASPDADGTMGGLVEMANEETFKRVFENAVGSASWCSNDPVCMELGTHGQGTHGSNLAACHSCCLLPETSCEMFNQALDRAVLVGDLVNTNSFKPFVSQ